MSNIIHTFLYFTIIINHYHKHHRNQTGGLKYNLALIWFKAPHVMNKHICQETTYEKFCSFPCTGHPGLCISQIHSKSKHPYTPGRPPGIQIIHSKTCLLITKKTTKITKIHASCGIQKNECND